MNWLAASGDRRDRWWSGARLLLALLLCVPMGRAARADDAPASEAAVKAAYVYRLCSYVSWPAAQRAPSGPIVIGTLNAPDVHAELLQLLPGRKVEGRDIVVRSLQEGESVDAAHLVFVGSGPAPKPSTLQKLAITPGLLVVTEQADGLAQGSAINFIRVAGRIRFEAAPVAAERNGLKLSARLLAVAERVVSAP